VNATAEKDRNAVAVVTDKVIKNVNDGVFCSNVMTSGKVNSVPFLLSPISLGAIGAICSTENPEPTFKVVFFRRYERQPSSMPSGSPSRQPIDSPTPVKPQLITASFVGIFCTYAFLAGLY
jgi:hypothetical protein